MIPTIQGLGLEGQRGRKHAILVQGGSHRVEGTLTEARGVRGDRGCGAEVDRNPRVFENFKYFGPTGPCNVGLVSGLDLQMDCLILFWVSFYFWFFVLCLCGPGKFGPLQYKTYFIVNFVIILKTFVNFVIILEAFAC
ncbi:hypothetical protein ERO13_A04G036201v2 [Gossypium hirsutum]|nr:hypothetical protein ERO13_A04G036201v2 [Gossypium hirsutum]